MLQIIEKTSLVLFDGPRIHVRQTHDNMFEIYRNGILWGIASTPDDIEDVRQQAQGYRE